MQVLIDWFVALSGWQWAVVVCCAVVGIISLWLVCHRIAMSKRRSGGGQKYMKRR